MTSASQNKVSQVPSPLPARRALISVSDKTGLVDFARGLEKLGIDILSTGGTATALKGENIRITDVESYTGFPEIMDGRVKTLHPRVHGGILARRDVANHIDAMDAHGIHPIDLVVINLYPFAATVRSGKDRESCIENIDVGGPAMIRAAAKNHAFVTVITDPADYDVVLSALQGNNGVVPDDLRADLAARAFAATAAYDAMIASWLAPTSMPPAIAFGGTLAQTLRYGENPHQSAAFYTDLSGRPGVATAHQAQGKELSFNNLNDTDAAFELVSEFDSPAVAIIKHANPCGVALGKTMLDAYERALSCDPLSAFGGIIALNRPLDAGTAEAILRQFCEVIIAPSMDDDAASLLKSKPNIRVLITGSMPDKKFPRLTVRSLAGGLLVQNADTGHIEQGTLQVVTKKQPTPDEIQDMLFAFHVCKHVKSNAIVYARDGLTLGIGAGQMSRVDSCKIAAWKMKDRAASSPSSGMVVASDAFFPFADGLLEAVAAGATAVIQPGGSMRDKDVIEAADKAGIAMVMTGMRHFRH